MKIKHFLILAIFLLNTVYASKAEIKNVTVSKSSNNLYTFNVTILHNDTGWNHYINKWTIVDSNDNIIATRILHHPHVNEQPFTRSKSNVLIDGTSKEYFIKIYENIKKNSIEKYPIFLKK